MLLSLLWPLAAAAADIVVQRVAGEPEADPASPAWLKQPATSLKVYPQTSVPPATVGAGPGAVKLRAQAGATTLALHLEWPDRKPAMRRGVNQFADAAAVQWPLRHAGELPHVGMGHRGAPVVLWFWRADGTAETLAAEGFGTLTRQATDGLRARGVWQNGLWRVVLSAAATAPATGVMPLAIAVWNGEGAERDGLKRLSAWQTLRFASAALGVGAGDTAPRTGNGARGKRLMRDKGCAACHGYPSNPARPVVGPDLSHAGGLHAAAYLAESLRDPSKVVVPGRGYFTEQDGRRVSIMPPFEGSEAERDDILAYLRGLR